MRKVLLNMNKQQKYEIIHQILTQYAPPAMFYTDRRTVFEYKKIKTMDTCGLQTHFHRGTKGLVIKTFDGHLLFSTNEQV